MDGTQHGISWLRALSKDGFVPGPQPRDGFTCDSAVGPSTNRWPPFRLMAEGTAQEREWRCDGGRLATRGLYGGGVRTGIRTEGIIVPHPDNIAKRKVRDAPHALRYCCDRSYLISTLAPAASSFSLILAASSLATPSLTARSEE